MKKSVLIPNLFLLLLFVSPIELISQNNIYQRLDSIIYLGTDMMRKFSYDENRNNSARLDFIWDEQEMMYVDQSKYKYEYDSNNNCTLIELHLLDTLTSNWFLYRRNERSFENKNKLLSEKTFVWDYEKEQLKLTSKIDYEHIYDSENRVTEIIYYIGNTQNQIISHIQKRKENNEWANGSKHEFNYDEKGNISEQILYHSDHSKLYQKIEYFYDYSYSFDQLLTNVSYSSYYDLKLYDFHVNNMISKQMIYYFDRLDWEHIGTNRYYYSPTEITGINQNSLSVLSVYPNPATDYLNVANVINESTISLFNQFGKEVISKNISSNYKLPVGQFPSGLYLLRINSGNGEIQTEKVVIN